MGFRQKAFKLPGFGRMGVFHEGSGFGVGLAGGAGPRGHLGVIVRDKNGRIKRASEYMSLKDRLINGVHGNTKELDLGTGLVTNVGVMAMANDFAWASDMQTLKLSNWHATGKGATADAATDIALQTNSTVGGQTPVAGAQSFVSAANVQKYRSVATISYTGGEAVTEWGLFTDSTLSITTGTPFTATSATSGTATGTPYTASTASVRGQTQKIVVAGTTTVYGLITGNTTSVLNIPAWYTVAGGTAGSTPGSTEAFSIKPVMFDHRVFAAINVVNGDSIQWTYTLTINSGG